MSESKPIRGVTGCDPPSKSMYDWDAISRQLRANPMKWAKIFERDRTSIVNAIRQGGVTALHPDLGFEVKTRNNLREPERVCSLYLRFNPRKRDELRGIFVSSREEKKGAAEGDG